MIKITIVYEYTEPFSQETKTTLLKSKAKRLQKKHYSITEKRFFELRINKRTILSVMIAIDWPIVK